MAFVLAGREVCSQEEGPGADCGTIVHQHKVFVKKSSASLRHVQEKAILERFEKSWCHCNSSWQELICLQKRNVKSGLSQSGASLHLSITRG